MYTTHHLPNTRIDVADALRGIAVAGIILYHSVEHFNIFTQETIIHPLPSDQTVANVLAWLLSGKMYGIFAMLFGLSFFIMNDNQQQKGRSFSGRFAWRMCLLFLFGVVNVAFYDGDILMLYACYGLLLIPISYLPSKAVWCIIALLAIQPVELFCLLTGYEMDHSTMWELYGKINSAMVRLIVLMSMELSLRMQSLICDMALRLISGSMFSAVVSRSCSAYSFLECS